MNQKLIQWLDQCALQTGITGCGVHLPDGSSVSRSTGDLGPQAAFNDAMSHLDESLPSFFAHGFAPRWMTWTFEQGELRVALRPDGLLLTLAIQPNSTAALSLDMYTNEFLSLDLAV